MQFNITPEDRARIQDWLKNEVYPEVVAKQRADASGRSEPFMQDGWDEGIPYAGACGGDLTYNFTPTSLGVVFTVGSWGKTLDLTDYGSW